jgi:hypothetical protein
VHSAGPAFGPRLNPIGRGGLLARWPKGGRRPVDMTHGHAVVVRLARASRRGRRARGMVTVAGVGAGGQGSPVASMQCGQRREYDDGEGRSSGNKDGDVAHQGGSGADEVANGATR